MTAQRLILWRHGQTEYNLASRIQGGTDIPLDAVGRVQVEQAAVALAALRPHAIVSSDLVRAADTARALSRITGLDIAYDPRLRERAFGQWEGLAMAELAAHWPDQYARWRRGQEVPEVGLETRVATAERYVAAVRDALATIEDGPIVIVAHGGVIVSGLTALLGLDPSEWLGLRVMENAHWAVVDASAHVASGWRLAGYNIGVVPGAPAAA
jgi:probable phosphoglycerate mutase